MELGFPGSDLLATCASFIPTRSNTFLLWDQNEESIMPPISTDISAHRLANFKSWAVYSPLVIKWKREIYTVYYVYNSITNYKLFKGLR